MEPLSVKPKHLMVGDIENWDDDEDLQSFDDLQFRNVSSTTVGSTPHHRESISSRMSVRSDRESVGGGDEDWQMLLPTDDENSRADAINSAKCAGIPIPQNVPASALIGGTIKRMGGRQVKKILGEDWSEDIQLPRPQEGGLKLRKSEGNFPETLRGFSAEFPTSPSPSKPSSLNKSFMERMTMTSRKMPNTTASLEKYRDGEDDGLFGDVPTIKIAKNRSPQRPLQLAQLPGKSSIETENLEDELELPANGQPLKLSTRMEAPRTPASHLNDDFDMEWAEGSLGTRFGGTRRDNRSNPSSSISAFSPSASSVLTGESEDEGLEGLVLPDGPIKFGEVLKKRLENVAPDPPEKAEEKPAGKFSAHNDARIKDDFFSGIEVGNGEVFDSGKLTLNRNIKRKVNGQTSPVRRPATTLTFTNKIEQGISKIPRPQFQDRPRSTLESVSETGGAVPHYRRPGSRMGGHSAQSSLSAIPTPSTPSPQNTAQSTPSRRGLQTKSSRDTLRSESTSNPTQFLKAKRSMPAMGRTQASPARPQPSSHRPPSRGGERGGSRQALSNGSKTPIDGSGAESSMANARKPLMPFLPAGMSHAQSHHISAKSSRHFHRPNSSDSNENAPTNRPLSRLSNNLHRPTTPTARRDHAPESLTREAASKRTLTRPTRRRAFGDGNELDAFDDLPTSASTESKFTKQPIARGAPKSMQTRSKLGLQQKNASSTSINTEPAIPTTPSTPLSPVKHDPLPRFARDTNASRLAREQRMGSVSAALHATPSLPAIREAGGPLSSISTNFKAPMPISHKTISSPMPHSKKRSKAPPQKPQLIKQMGGDVRSTKGMHWNPVLLRWEGNENALAPFDVPAPSHIGLGSPRSPGGTKAAPALIANVGAPKGVQMSGGMVFDPQRMCWLKAAPHLNARADSNPLSPSTIDEDEDPFAGLDDLSDAPKGGTNKGASVSGHVNESFAGSLASTGTGVGKIALDEDEGLVGEEFDVGPDFVRRQRAEEERWRAKVEGWVGDGVVRDHAGGRKDVWKWAIREKAMIG